MNRSLFFVITLIASSAAFILAADSKSPVTAPASFEAYTQHVKGTLVKIDMVPIKGGRFSFAIGKAAPQELQIKSFWMAKTECTWDQFETFWLQTDLSEKERKFLRRDAGDAQTRPTPAYDDPHKGFGQEGYPAITMTAHSAMMYCRWLSEKTARKYRLPTEAEWEYACRARGQLIKLDKSALEEVAWFVDNSQESTHPVMTKKPNTIGLYDMLGNAGEWCSPMEGKVFVLRGGWYATNLHELHCGSRVPFDPAWQKSDDSSPPSKWWLSDSTFSGFRVIREE
jgi:formylglycine-generating enzyme required for sulfatase activity